MVSTYDKKCRKCERKIVMIMEKMISVKLRQLGVPTNIRGFDYLKTAIVLVDADHNYIYAITKRLYPDIAREHDTTPTRVERNIRHAIECAFSSGNFEELKTLGVVHWNSGKMTNGEFIGALYECLRYEMCGKGENR